MMRVTTLDTETTGFEPESNSLVEMALVDIGGDYWHSLLRPTTPIGFGAMGTHHITEEIAREAPPATDFLGIDVTCRDIFVAHNAKFDAGFLPPLWRKCRWICTWKCALTLWPDAESHKNQSLRYELGLDVSDMPAEAGGEAHRALYDAWVTHKLLLRMLETHTLRQLVTITESPVLLTKFSFGKHSGQPLEEVPTTYLHWITGQDFDEDTLHTARTHLRRRGALS